MKYILVGMLFIISCNESYKTKKFLHTDEIEIANRADSLYRIDQYENAELCYDTLIFYSSSNPNYYFKRGYSKYILQSDNRNAIIDFFQAIKYGYKNPASAYLNIGTLYRIEGKYDSAIIYYDQALKLDSKNEKAKQSKQEVLDLLKRQL